MNLLPFAIGWIILLAATVILALYRARLAREEDDIPHISEPEAEVYASRQLAIAQKLEKIEFWGKVLVILLIIYGLGLAVAYSYQVWVESSKIRY